MAFTAGFFFGQPFFHFYEISRPRSFIFLSFFFPARFAPSVFSCSVLIITHFFRCSSGAATLGRDWRKQEDECQCEGTEDTNQLVGLRGSGSTVDKIGSRRVLGGRGGGCLFEPTDQWEPKHDCEIWMTGRSRLVSGSEEASFWRWTVPPLRKRILVVEKGMNRESDERDILGLVRAHANPSETPGAFAEPRPVRDRVFAHVEPAPRNL